MARIGSFGRRRRAQGNMSSLIVSLMREYHAARDRAIFDAWQNGGLFEGKQVDDKTLLAYVTGRRDGFSKDDPLYDEWNNRFIQLNFRIGEEKIGLAFKQGKVGAGAVANFYRSQLKSIPKDSAFYREVAGRAAQWAKSTVGAARGAARGRVTRAIDSKMANEQVAIDTFDALYAYVSSVAQSMNDSPNALQAPPAELISALASLGIPYGDGTLDIADLQQAAIAKYEAMGRQIALSEQAGRTTKERREQRARFVGDFITPLNAMGFVAQYQAVNGDFVADVAALGGDPYAIADRTAQYAKELTRLRDAMLKPTGLAAVDPSAIGGLNNEIAMVTDPARFVTMGPDGPVAEPPGPTLLDQIKDTSGQASPNDAKNTALSAFGNLMDRQAIEQGYAYIGQKTPGGPLVVLKKPTASLYAVGDPFGEDEQEALVTINGVTRPVHLKGEPVKAAVVYDEHYGPLDQEAINERMKRAGVTTLEELLKRGLVGIQETDEVAGYTFVNPLNGDVTYGVPTPDGMRFTKENPFGDIAPPGVLGEGAVTITGGDLGPDEKTFIPNLTPIQQGVANEAPVLASGVAPRDLIKLINSGAVKGDPARLSKYVEDFANDFITRERARSDYRTGERGGTAATRESIRRELGLYPDEDRFSTAPVLRVPSMPAPPASRTVTGPGDIGYTRLSLPTIPTLSTGASLGLRPPSAKPPVKAPSPNPADTFADIAAGLNAGISVSPTTTKVKVGPNPLLESVNKGGHYTPPGGAIRV